MKLSPKIFLLILIYYESTILSFAGPAIKNESPNDVFRSLYSKRMKSFMNISMDPCDDFYEYACGNYPNVIEDIELTRKQNSLYDLTHSMDKIIDVILQKKRQPNEKYFEELQKVKQFVEVCDSADLFPLKPNEEYIKTIKNIGGFPAVDPAWNASTFNWFNMTSHLLRYGVIGFVKEDIFMRYPFAPLFEIGKFGFGFDVYSDNIETNESLGYVHNVAMMKRLLKIYGVVGSTADKVIEEIINFWREALPFQNKAKDGCNEFEEDESEKEQKFPQWNSLIEIAWDLQNYSETDVAPCPCDFYFNQLNVMANKSSKAFANYMALKFLYEMHPQVKSVNHQHQHCLTQVKHGIPMVLTYFYIKEHFNKETLQEVEEMIEEIVKSFTAIVVNTDWLDEQTRFGTQDVLKILKSTIGQVVDPISDIYIKETKKLNLTNNYALNNLELNRFKVDISHYVYLHSDKIDNAVPFDILTAILPNAFYDITENSINVLAGILFPPIYHQSFPKSMKYGGLGFIIGHEVVHSLDPRGKWGEKHFKSIHAWTGKSRSAMKNNSACFIDHHSNFTVPELNIKLDGKESLTETVCDSGGLRGSLTALRNVLKAVVGNKTEEAMESMPGLNLSPDQTFFLNFAQVYCAKYEPRHFWSELYAGYPMDKYRVVLPLQNFDEFSKVFNCPLGSAMNPEKKCRMW
ncbi:neprilysin-4-like [Episyrphus balteatus]|uniref:neprilysin-4-like n=1 Tax=Episyrphus balteatus TaxID=286459 RepID=UPI002485A64E|nr:neprilysin-4-like [Episyrphus balteatus]